MAQPGGTGNGRERAMRLGLRLAGALHRAVYRLSGGRLAGSVRGGLPTLLLTTTGRRSGLPRTWPLGYLTEGESLIVVASALGLPNHPAWYLNLRDDPAVAVQTGDRTRPMRAETATGAERARPWGRVVAAYPFFADYQARTERQIPVVVLCPA